MNFFYFSRETLKMSFKTERSFKWNGKFGKLAKKKGLKTTKFSFHFFFVCKIMKFDRNNEDLRTREGKETG